MKQAMVFVAVLVGALAVSAEVQAKSCRSKNEVGNRCAISCRRGAEASCRLEQGVPQCECLDANGRAEPELVKSIVCRCRSENACSPSCEVLPNPPGESLLRQEPALPPSGGQGSCPPQRSLLREFLEFAANLLRGH